MTSISIEQIIESINKKTNAGKSVKDYIDEITLKSGMGKLSNVRDQQFIGFNHRHTAVNLPPNMDFAGHCFFVRPNLNLARNNAIRVRQLAQLITNDPMSIQQWCRMTLDYRLVDDEGISSPLVDNYNAFIPLLSNSLKTLTGVPSLVAGTHTSERGIAKEVFSMIDDNIINYDSYTVSCSFRNMNGNPFLILFYSWILAASMQYLGRIEPRMIDRMQKRLNYTTRIYRLVLDHTQTFVTNIWAPVYCFPVSLEIGSTFKYDIEGDPFNKDNDFIDVQFQCVGSVFNDDLLINQFNSTVALANPEMFDSTRKSSLVKITKEEANILNYNGYPRINPSTTELEWWVPKQVYENARQRLTEYKSGSIAGVDSQLLQRNKDIAEASGARDTDLDRLVNGLNSK